MTQTRQIMRAVLAGARTSREIASAIGAPRGNISVALHKLANSGAIERAGVVNTNRVGRPYVRWRARTAAASPAGRAANP